LAAELSVAQGGIATMEQQVTNFKREAEECRDQMQVEIQKPVRSAEKQKQLDLAAAELKCLQSQGHVPPALLTSCAMEAAKPDVTPQKPAVDIWGDDMWD